MTTLVVERLLEVLRRPYEMDGQMVPQRQEVDHTLPDAQLAAPRGAHRSQLGGFHFSCRYLLNPAMRLIVVAMISAPNM